MKINKKKWLIFSILLVAVIIPLVYLSNTYGVYFNFFYKDILNIEPKWYDYKYDLKNTSNNKTYQYDRLKICLPFGNFKIKESKNLKGFLVYNSNGKIIFLKRDERFCLYQSEINRLEHIKIDSEFDSTLYIMKKRYYDYFSYSVWKLPSLSQYFELKKIRAYSCTDIYYKSYPAKDVIEFYSKNENESTIEIQGKNKQLYVIRIKNIDKLREETNYIIDTLCFL